MHKLKTRQDLRTALDAVAQSDKDMARAYNLYGAPVLRKGETGFSGLIYILIGQQVSTAAARAIKERLFAALNNEVTPEAFLTLTPQDLKAIGLSRQKQTYITGIAEAVMAGRLNFRSLARADDAQVRKTLLDLKGVGPWTVDIYLMFSMQRADIMPIGDLGLQEGCKLVKRLKTRPTPEKLEKISQKWAPYRTVASLLLWHYYDMSRKQKG